MNNKYSDNLVNEFISPDVLAMLDKDIMEKRFMMPLSYDKDSHVLTVVTSRFEDNFMDMSIILALVRKNYPDLERIDFLACDYNNFSAGFNAHYKQQFQPAALQAVEEKRNSSVTSEQTRKSEEILQKGIALNASDIHITPMRNGANVIYRRDGVLVDSGMTLSVEDVSIRLMPILTSIILFRKMAVSLL